MMGWFQPGHVPVVLTRQPGYSVPGGHVVSSVQEAMALAARQGADELVVCGGGKVYAATLPEADEVILTKVKLEVVGEPFFPEMADDEWMVVEEQAFPADEENAWPMTISRLVRGRR